MTSLKTKAPTARTVGEKELIVKNQIACGLALLVTLVVFSVGMDSALDQLVASRPTASASGESWIVGSRLTMPDGRGCADFEVRNAATPEEGHEARVCPDGRVSVFR